MNGALCVTCHSCVFLFPLSYRTPCADIQYKRSAPLFFQAGEELPFSKDEVPALNSASHTQDDSSPQKLLMHTQLMAQNNDCKSPKADDLSDQELNDACTSTVAETPVVQLIFSAKDYLVTTNRNQTVTETTGPSPKFSDSQHDKRDDNTLMAVASCMGYNSVLEFDICMRLLSYLRVISAICVEAKLRCSRRRSLVVRGVIDIQVGRTS